LGIVKAFLSELAVLLSRKIDLDSKNIQTARISGNLHATGKIWVPESILLIMVFTPGRV
jgi:HD-GYP domain-containing protein (c-di-GMP phosphodiesterase class II)